MKGKILLGCFDVFRDEDVCRSREAYFWLKENKNDAFAARLLTVGWEENRRETEAIAQEDWRAVVFLGNGRGGEHKIEKLGLNAQGTNILDNRNERCGRDVILEEGKAAYFSVWNTEKLLEEMRKKAIPCQLSYYPGLFLCNGSLYRSLHHESGKKEKRPTLLIHLSPEREIAKDLPGILEALQDSLAGI
ncbi:hypothetical protein IKW72_09105 [bacterium]|nr:hypothetical protein [bacterium]MBR5625137.1 hypothetical protein [bacterium]